jgi:hypothetical protein
MTPLQNIQASIAYARSELAVLEAAARAILRSAEHNTFETLKDADIALASDMYHRAGEDCEGSHCCGEDEYTQEFMVGTQKYLATMTFEYSRHDKTYYYIDSSDYTSKEI